jgi:hypothetical protein
MSPKVPSTAIAVLVATVLASGCVSRPRVDWIPDGPSRTITEVVQSVSTVDISAVRDVRIEDAPDERTAVLVWLREQGTDGDRAASLLTQGFPTRTASVPVRVEIAPVDGVRSLIAVEAFGEKTGLLVYRRVWVFEMDSGRLVRSAAFR